MPRSPILFNDMLEQAGIAPAEVRLLRHHTDPGLGGQSLHDLWRRDRKGFELYQSTQKANARLFRTGKVWASFVSPEPSVSMFVGLYEARFSETMVADWTCPYRGDFPGDGEEIDVYATELLPELSEHIGSLTIDWDPKSIRTWARYAKKAPFPVLSTRYRFGPEVPALLEMHSSQPRIRALPANYLFSVGELYTRKQIAAYIGLPEDKRGGNWETGYSKPFDDFFLFVNVGNKGRTGHDYPNRWEGSQLIWSAKTGTKLGQKEITAILSGNHPVHVFWRAKERARFTYAGLAAPIEAEDTTPVRVRWAFDANQASDNVAPTSPIHLRRGPPPTAGKRSTVYEDGPTSVYLLALEGPTAQLFPDIPVGRRIVKVGMSNDPIRRIMDLSCGIPPGCVLRWALVAERKFASGMEAFDFESMLLERLRNEHKWIGGEFAAVDEPEVAILAGLT